MRINRTDSVLVKLSQHLYYEFWMLGEAWKLRARARHQQDINVAVESFGIHARSLLDFLVKTSGSKTDFLAVDFLDDEDEASWKEYISDKVVLRGYIRDRVGKEIAHLTTNRLEVTPETKRWEFKDLHSKITGIFKEFLRRVPDSRIEQRLIRIRD